MVRALIDKKRGLTRTCILAGPYALKFPTYRGWTLKDRVHLFARGVLANQSEKDWSSVDGMNPVLWTCLGFINVSRRADPVEEHTVVDFESICPGWVPMTDKKTENVGYVDGKLVWLDFDMSSKKAKSTYEPL